MANDFLALHADASLSDCLCKGMSLRQGARVPALWRSLSWRHPDGAIKPNALAIEIAVGYQFQGEAAELFVFAQALWKRY